MKIQAENNDEEADRDTTPTPQVDEEDKANNLLDISEIKNPPEAQPVEEFRSLEKLGKILTPVQKLKNAEKINGTPTDIEKIKLEKPTTPVKNEEDGEQVKIKFIFTIILAKRSPHHDLILGPYPVVDRKLCSMFYGKLKNIQCCLCSRSTTAYGPYLRSCRVRLTLNIQNFNYSLFK